MVPRHPSVCDGLLGFEPPSPRPPRHGGSRGQPMPAHPELEEGLEGGGGWLLDGASLDLSPVARDTTRDRDRDLLQLADEEEGRDDYRRVESNNLKLNKTSFKIRSAQFEEMVLKWHPSILLVFPTAFYVLHSLTYGIALLPSSQLPGVRRGRRRRSEPRQGRRLSHAAAALTGNSSGSTWRRLVFCCCTLFPGCNRRNTHGDGCCFCPCQRFQCGRSSRGEFRGGRSLVPRSYFQGSWGWSMRHPV